MSREHTLESCFLFGRRVVSDTRCYVKGKCLHSMFPYFNSFCKGLRGCQNITSTQYFFKGWSIRPTDHCGNNIPDQGTTYGIGKRTATRLAAVVCNRSLPAGPCRNAKSASSASSNDHPFIICITEMMFNRITELILLVRSQSIINYCTFELISVEKI